jgi:tetratricopeptide (TPR) repeat protein
MTSDSKELHEASSKLVHIEYEISDEPLKDEYISNLPRHAQKKARRLTKDIYLLTLKDPKNAIPELEKALIIYPNNPRLYNFLGNAYRAVGETNKAKNVIIENFRINPDYLFARLNYAELLFNYGEYEKIPAVFDGKLELKTLYPNRNRFHTSEVAGFAGVIGAYFCMIGETNGAKIYYEILQKIDPNNMLTKRLKKLLYPSLMTKLYKKIMVKNQSILKSIQDNEDSRHEKEF